MSFSLLVAVVIFVAISIRQWLPAWLRIWQIMGAGALVLLLSGKIAPSVAFNAVDWNVIAYLFGVFSIASALYDSGVSHRLSNLLADGSNSFPYALFLLMAFSGVCAAVLTNDAAAVIGTPIALGMARLLGIRPTALLIGLCVAVTIGSMVTSVGNPQNILIAAKGHIDNPINSFMLWLSLPAILSMVFAFLWLWFYQYQWGQRSEEHLALPDPSDDTAPWPAYLSVALLIVFIVGDGLLQQQSATYNMPLGLIGLAACAPVYLFNSRRIHLVKEVDWATLTFFVAMFVVTGSVLLSGNLQSLLGPLLERLDEPVIVASISFWASQLFSNVPVVEIYLQLLADPELPTLMLLSAASTLAGNLFIISAASNVIVVQQTEKFGGQAFSFWAFTFIAMPITCVSMVISYVWIVYGMSAWLA